MARFPDHVAIYDTGVLIPDPDGSTTPYSPGLIVSALVAVHDTEQDGGVENVIYGDTPFWYQRINPFDVLYDVTISTQDYFACRDYFNEVRTTPGNQPSPGIQNLPLPTRTTYPFLFAPGRPVQGLFSYPDREDIAFRPVELPGYADPFGIPLSNERDEQGLIIRRQLVRKSMTQFVLYRGVYTF